MKIASVVLFVLVLVALVSLALTANALKSTKAQLARVQAQLADEVGRICSVSDMKHCKMPTNNGGYQDVQLYNLNVLSERCQKFDIVEH